MLNHDEVALIYITGAAESHLVVIEALAAGDASSDAISVITLPGSRAIAELVASVLDRGRLASRRIAPAWREAYRLLVAPVAERIRGKGLVIVPTGALCLMPFQVLVGDETDANGRRRFLVEEHRIRYAPSPGVLRLLCRSETERPASRSIALESGRSDLLA